VILKLSITFKHFTVNLTCINIKYHLNEVEPLKFLLFFYQFLQFLTYLEESISLPKKYENLRK
jgi:hypothetical protein